MNKKNVIFFLLIICSLFSNAQKPSEQTKKSPLIIRGNLNANMVLYNVDGIAPRRDPLFWMFNGNLVFEYKELSVPVSATLSQQNNNFTQPYNQFGISPRYKSLIVHAGYRSMQFSEYTLAGVIFLGGGFEFTPQKSLLKLSAMYGRFQKAVQIGGQIGIINGQPSYERWGYSGKITYGTNNNGIDFIFLKAKDDENSIDRSKLIQSGSTLSPAENLVLAGVVRKSFYKRFAVNAEYSVSAFTNDISAPSIRDEGFRYSAIIGSFFTPRTSSQFNSALTGGIHYNANKYSIGTVYKRIDPYYRTMGAIYLQNDREEITGTLALRLIKNTLNIATNAGLQRNNLDKTQLTTTQRFIGMVNIAYLINNKWNTSASYSNFNTNSIINTAPIGINVDSLKFFQVTQSISGGVNYSKGNNRYRHNYSVNFSGQDATDPYSGGSKFYNGNFSYQLNILPYLLILTSAINYNYTTYGESISSSYGPTFAASKQLFRKKLRLNYSSTYIKNQTQNQYAVSTFNNRFSATIKVGKKQSISVDVNYLNNVAGASSIYKSYNEARGGITYSLNF